MGRFSRLDYAMRWYKPVRNCEPPKLQSDLNNKQTTRLKVLLARDGRRNLVKKEPGLNPDTQKWGGKKDLEFDDYSVTLSSTYTTLFNTYAAIDKYGTISLCGSARFCLLGLLKSISIRMESGTLIQSSPCSLLHFFVSRRIADTSPLISVIRHWSTPMRLSSYLSNRLLSRSRPLVTCQSPLIAVWCPIILQVVAINIRALMIGTDCEWFWSLGSKVIRSPNKPVGVIARNPLNAHNISRLSDWCGEHQHPSVVTNLYNSV